MVIAIEFDLSETGLSLEKNEKLTRIFTNAVAQPILIRVLLRCLKIPRMIKINPTINPTIGMSPNIVR